MDNSKFILNKVLIKNDFENTEKYVNDNYLKCLEINNDMESFDEKLYY